MANTFARLCCPQGPSEGRGNITNSQSLFIPASTKVGTWSQCPGLQVMGVITGMNRDCCSPGWSAGQLVTRSLALVASGLQHRPPPHGLLGHAVVQPPQALLGTQNSPVSTSGGGSGTPQTPSFSPRPHLGVLQDVVDKHHSAPGVQQLLHVGVEVQSHFLVLVDAAELWGGGWVWGEPPEPPDA